MLIGRSWTDHQNTRTIYVYTFSNGVSVNFCKFEAIDGLQQRIQFVAMADALFRAYTKSKVCADVCACVRATSLSLSLIGLYACLALSTFANFFANIVFFSAVVAVVRCFIFANIWPCFWHIKTHACVCVRILFRAYTDDSDDSDDTKKNSFAAATRKTKRENTYAHKIVCNIWAERMRWGSAK